MEDNKEIWLGLDISTSCIGCTLLYNDGSQYGKVIVMTHVAPKVSKKITKDKDEALFVKVEIFRDEFLKKYKDIGIKRVVIEAPLLTSNNSETCSILLRFNGMISLAVYEELHVKPTYISSYEARQYSFPELMAIRKYNKVGEAYPNNKIISNIKKGNCVLFGAYPWDVDKKRILHEKISNIFPEIQWLYDKNGELKKENFDSTDSYVCLLGELNKERFGTLEIKLDNIQINEDNVTFKEYYWNVEKEIKVFLETKKVGN